MSLLVFYYILSISIVCAMVYPPNIIISPLIYDATINIVNSCSPKQSRTVAVITDTNDLLAKIFLSNNFTVVGFNVEHETRLYKHISENPRQSIQKLRYFAIETEVGKFNRNMTVITTSLLLWNPAAKVVVLEKTPLKNHCEHAQRYLGYMWMQYMLNAVFVCINLNNDVVLYTLAPYNRNAPDPWRDISVRARGFAIYNRIYDANNISCESIFFDKTKKLDGSRCLINMKSHPPLLTIRKSNTLMRDRAERSKGGVYRVNVKPDKWNEFFKGFDKNVFGTIFKFLNATAEVFIRSERNSLGSVELSPTTQVEMAKRDTLRDAQEHHFIDLGLNTRYVLSNAKTAILYPVLQSETTVITNDRGNVNLLTQIVAYFNTGVAVSIIIISGVAIIVLRFLGFQTYGSAGMNAFRFLLGTAIQQIPTSIPARIILGCLMPYFLIMVATFQGYFAHVLIVPRIAKNADKVQDLVTFQHTVYAGDVLYKYYRNYDERFKNLKNVITESADDHNIYDHCVDIVMKNYQAACIDDLVYLKFHAAHNEMLHVMKEPLEKVYTTYTARSNWPLIDRINGLMSRLRESGILGMWWTRTLADSDKYIIGKEINRTAKVVKKLNLEKLWIFFIFLIIGLIVSTVVFIFEVLTYKFG